MPRNNRRLSKHPILPIPENEKFDFNFNNTICRGAEGETISSALFANGINVFGHHPGDHSPQGIFCANGQCSQCTVIADGMAVKSCMEPVKPGMNVFSCDKLPVLPPHDMYDKRFHKVETFECDVMIIGAGPAGIAAAIELGKLGKSVIIVDDKVKPGGKLVLQTHTFFGSISDCHAGTRGIDIAEILSSEMEKYPSIKLFLNSTALGVFADQKIGVVRDNQYFLIKPIKLLVAAGARERALGFPGWDLPGIYRAGAFQTLLNRDLVRPSDRLFIIGGGNVGLIAGYHAMQAGITVAGLVEAMPQVGGYKVHADKLKRLGVPIYLSHSVLRADGDETGVKTITITEIDKFFKPVKGTEKKFEVDTVLIATGLAPISEMYEFARKIGMDVYAAGDANEIAEASAAMFGGKIAGLTIAADMGENVTVPEEWHKKAEVLKSRPGNIYPTAYPKTKEGVFPVFHCIQEIPCNPCTEVCPHNSISIDGESIMGIPHFADKCTGCTKCIAICPGLAISLVDFRKAEEGFAHITIPFELLKESIEGQETVPAVDMDGNFLYDAPVVKIADPKFADRTLLVTIKVPADIACKTAGIRIQKPEDVKPLESNIVPEEEDVIICRCSRVTASQVRERIRSGLRDMNQLKAELNLGMGACGGKTCGQLVERLFKEEGITPDKTTLMTYRPLNMEVTLGMFAGMDE
jgi:NADPH-dependent 2,4-dienoyl-CoA reductase/sulfur reductase-like enzyme/Fe-S-cluster-containing hydrogenase component 2/bacterioferritin-associated ferredoxin